MQSQPLSRNQRNAVRVASILAIALAAWYYVARLFGTNSAKESRIVPCLREKAASGVPFSVADCEGGNWDHVLILPPYSYPSQVSEKWLIDLPRSVWRTGIESRDDICVLVFLREKKAVSWTEVPRTMDFAFVRGEFIKRENAKFSVSRTGEEDGWELQLAGSTAPSPETWPIPR